MVPSIAELNTIPLARAGEYELTDAEVRRTRRLLYSLNKQGDRKYRTQREFPYLLVWRIK